MLRLFILVVLYSATSCYKFYDGYKIVRVNVGSADDHQGILHLESEDLLSLLSESRSGKVDVLISPKSLATCQEYFQSRGMKFSVITANVGAEIRKDRKRLYSTTPLQKGEFSYDTYHRLQVIYEHLDALAEKHSSNAETFNLAGNTYEGRKIQAIRITANISSAESKEKPMIWLDGGIHAREWVSPSTVTFIIDSLLGEQEADKSTQMTDLLKEFQFVIAPVINPDGYEYSHTHDRLWRKTRKPYCRWNKKTWWGGCFYKLCYGADPNRNWSADWGREGVSPDECSLVFPGRKAFDNENTRMVKEYLEPLKDKLVLYVTYHSYSQLFLTPLGYTTKEPENYAHHVKVGSAVVAAIAQRHGAKYINQRSAALYPASGDSADWVHDVLGLTDTYTFELRPDEDSPFGFKLPEDQILETGQENVDGLLALIANIEYNEKKQD